MTAPMTTTIATARTSGSAGRRSSPQRLGRGGQAREQAGGLAALPGLSASKSSLPATGAALALAPHALAPVVGEEDVDAAAVGVVAPARDEPGLLEAGEHPRRRRRADARGLGELADGQRGPGLHERLEQVELREPQLAVGAEAPARAARRAQEVVSAAEKAACSEAVVADTPIIFSMLTTTRWLAWRPWTRRRSTSSRTRRRSDGALAPAAVVAAAADAGVELLALTDHDTVDGVDEALAGGRGSRPPRRPRGGDVRARHAAGRTSTSSATCSTIARRRCSTASPPSAPTAPPRAVRMAEALRACGLELELAAASAPRSGVLTSPRPPSNILPTGCASRTRKS